MAVDSKNAPPPYGQLEWEPIKPAMRRRLQVCFDHAQKQLQQKGGKADHDYAHTMLVQCVTNDPGNMVYVEAFLDNLHKKHKSNKKGGGGGGNRGPFKKAVKENNWEEILKAGPELLKSNPWDTTVLRPMADAAGVYGFNEVELRYLKNALDANLNDIEVNKHCAETLARVGQFDQAIACWRRIGAKRGKNDKEVDNMISDLTLRKTRVLTGLGDDDKATGRVVNEEALGAKKEQTVNASIGADANKEDSPKKKIELTPRQKLERAISENPEDLESYKELAAMHQEEGRLSEAVDVLTKALAASGGDFRLQEQLEDTQLLQMRQQLSVAEKRAAAKGDEESQNLLEQMKTQYHRRELEIYSARSQRRPDDHKLKLELGVRLKRAGNFEEAEKTLMEVRKNPKMKPLATYELGECLQQQQKYNNAMQFYARAVELTADADPNLRKMALYRAGVLAMGLKQYPVAEQYLQTLSKIDARFKDVLTRLDKVRKLRQTG